MNFTPPRCPNPTCPQHSQPAGRFYYRHGSFVARCRERPVPRFRCRECGKGFSLQTFRHDYRDRRPDCNALLFDLLTSGVGLRQSARVLQLHPSSVQKKMHKIARTCRRLHRNLSARLPAGRTYLLDEEETYEGASIRPLTVPVLMEGESWYLVSVAVGSIRRLAAPGTKRRCWQDREEGIKGIRRDRSRACVRLVLGRLAQKVTAGSFTLRTDEKSSYRTIARELFGDRVRHETTPGTLARGTSNRLFAVNTTIAMTRDNCGRMRRRTWLVSKKARYTRLQLHLFVAFRNYVRQRFNRDNDPWISSASTLGLLPRSLRPGELLRWRQDWGARSIHPLSFLGSTTVATTLQGAG